MAASLKIYVNGDNKGTSSRSGSLTSTTAEADIGRGEQGVPNSNYWKGDIDEVRFYNRPLSDGEIQSLYVFQPHAVSKVGTTNYNYEKNGNMNAGTARTWDVENRLTSITVAGTTTNFTYDGDGYRIKQAVVSGNTTVYPNKLYEIITTTGNATTHYYLGDKQVALKQGSTLSYIQEDSLGSTSVIADSGGNSYGTITYYPFGLTKSTTGIIPTDEKFTGQRLDSTGLYYYGARYYDPNIGRFISPDTVTSAPSDPQSLNRYSYVLNNPLKYIDPTGHFAEDLLNRSGVFKGDGRNHVTNSTWEMLIRAHSGDVLTLLDKQYRFMRVSGKSEGDDVIQLLSNSGEYYNVFELLSYGALADLGFAEMGQYEWQNNSSIEYDSATRKQNLYDYRNSDGTFVSLGIESGAEWAVFAHSFSLLPNNPFNNTINQAQGVTLMFSAPVTFFQGLAGAVSSFKNGPNLPGMYAGLKLAYRSYRIFSKGVQLATNGSVNLPNSALPWLWPQ